MTYHSMKLASFVALWSALGALALACAELAEIVGGPRGCVGKEFHFDTAEGFAWTGFFVRVYFWMKMVISVKRENWNEYETCCSICYSMIVSQKVIGGWNGFPSMKEKWNILHISKPTTASRHHNVLKTSET